MKRNNLIDNYFIKKVCTNENRSITISNDFPSTSSSISAEVIDHTTTEENNSDNELQLPECWNFTQAKMFREKYDGLIIKNKKLGCFHCEKFSDLNINKEKHIHISLEWKNCQIESAGTNKTIRQASLRKKMSEHFNSKSHNAIVNIINQSKKDVFVQFIDNLNEKSISATSKVFNTVYSLIKRNRPLSDLQSEVQLQVKNGLDMGISLHSRYTATRIAEHISIKLKENLFSKIISMNAKICIIIDEASTLAIKSVLIIYLKIEMESFNPIIFLDLVELESQSAENIYKILLLTLKNTVLIMNI